jgi:hypothetical protein
MEAKNPIFALELYAERVLELFPNRVLIPGIHTQSCLEMYFGVMKQGQREMSAQQYGKRTATKRNIYEMSSCPGGNDANIAGYDRVCLALHNGTTIYKFKNVPYSSSVKVEVSHPSIRVGLPPFVTVHSNATLDVQISIPTSIQSVKDFRVTITSKISGPNNDPRADWHEQPTLTEVVCSFYRPKVQNIS